MGERQDREWVAMTPGDFDVEAPLVLNVGTGPATVPAEPDEYGTAPLFGEAAPAPGTRPRGRRGRPAPGQQTLF
ncbi:MULTISPECIES: hypothetical protein [Streptomyces]|uniref:Uncharacterized protein n=1 Tax=Streptomyces olivaceus TaxID=47716 RepID=A0ABS7W1G0_STROV|nr:MULTISPECIES: hypothetical protein [Streptomyces]MBZ6084616.1 hypothetical protein [Streptomyces olivaceus]MBZ6088306.1 hypothetical protein [Streptomyces olivaceus]MBZ6094858.1 hypothetical protein [Streptomyces olivaceus]MBZ6105396.1 hypothetical protein [Streptomyces olivaceus]MBZ6108935.1 hypothetical protein [Streptomyces olivaceus]